ncbi:ATP-binding protein [Neobacillus pocheonensis]|uniref:histidine kinase n=1 Tax=Neobacillus pocheonensis TaxID=363869 RepID=A0ABT0WCI2_9BACI|nr:ATP-binding protein [Neobacillus pocheonensis]
MFTFLFVSYVYMVLPNKVIVWLSLITIFSSIISSFIHYLFTKPIESSIQLLAKQSQQIAKRKFEGSLPEVGPTEIKELTKQFNDMNTQLNEAFTQINKAEVSRKELVANISHDLRTPMSSIKAFVSAIEDGVVEDDTTFKRYLKTISLETERMDQLIQQLFQLSLLDSGAIKLKRERTNVDELLISVLQHEQIHLEKKNIEMKVDLPSQIPAIYVDTLYFQKLLFNLIDNAIRFSRVNGTIKIEVNLLEKQMLGISILDFGEGISKEDLPHIFERTYRVEKSRNLQFGGAGLGLAIAKTIAESHDGTIVVTSELGEGSTFTVVIPIHKHKVGETDEL